MSLRRVCNKLMTKKQVSDVLDHVYRHCGQKDTVIFCDRLMALGFGQACNAGISFCIADLTTPDLKEKYVNEAEAEVKTFEQQYLDGLITQGEVVQQGCRRLVSLFLSRSRIYDDMYLNHP
mgnify:CR=1 FL=1